jgi:hypothetical protein
MGPVSITAINGSELREYVYHMFDCQGICIGMMFCFKDGWSGYVIKMEVMSIKIN